MNNKILYGVTAASTARAFVAEQAAFVASAGFEVGVVSSHDEKLRKSLQSSNVRYFPVNLNRAPSPIGDLRQFFKVLSVVRNFKPDVVIAGTPKMSLVLLAASLLLGVVQRVYICHGLRYEGEQGVPRACLVLLERFLARMATEVVAVSESVAQGLIGHGVPENRVTVLGSGSPDGVDTRKFIMRSKGDHGSDPFVVLFAGRLTPDKGIGDLAVCARSLPHIEFRVAGEIDVEGSSVLESIAELRKLPNVRLLGNVVDMPCFYASGDVLFLPTKREGLPTVVIEAAACGVPTIAWDATGTRDAIVSEVTGFLLRQGDTEAAVTTIAELARSPIVLSRMSRQARELIEKNFDQEEVRRNWVSYISRLC